MKIAHLGEVATHFAGLLVQRWLHFYYFLCRLSFDLIVIEYQPISIAKHNLYLLA